MTLRSYPKASVVRSEAYRRYVAALPCWLCGRHGLSQAAHADQGKGAMFKACDLTCWPGCAPHDGQPGCHARMGASGLYTKAERRELEQQAAAETRALLVRMSEADAALRRVLLKVGVLP